MTTVMAIPKRLFAQQHKLDTRITEEKNINNEDVIMERILAALVELGEFTNEWREFKFWSENRTSNTVAIDVDKLDMKKIKKGQLIDLSSYVTNPMLEEYVDVLHFILSIGNHLDMSDTQIRSDLDVKLPTTLETILQVFNDLSGIASKIGANDMSVQTKQDYEVLFNRYIQLGVDQLGYPLREIVDAYFDKNEVNFERQENGY